MDDGFLRLTIRNDFHLGDRHERKRVGQVFVFLVLLGLAQAILGARGTHRRVFAAVQFRLDKYLRAVECLTVVHGPLGELHTRNFDRRSEFHFLVPVLNGLRKTVFPIEAETWDGGNKLHE